MIDRTRSTKRDSGRRDVRETRGVYLGLRRCGLSVAEAGNLTARLEGIHPVPGGWSLRDVERLRFLRWLVTSGQLGADDIVPGPITIAPAPIGDERPRRDPPAAPTAARRCREPASSAPARRPGPARGRSRFGYD